jgi:hypothetical protein
MEPPMTASRVDVIYNALLDALGDNRAGPGTQTLATNIHDALNDWERERHASSRHAELAVGVAHRIFGFGAPHAVIGNAANILMSLGGSGLAALIKAADEYDAKTASDKGKRVADALARKPAVLIETIHDLRQRGIKVAGPWEWASSEMAYRKSAIGDTLAAQIKRLLNGNWEWCIESRIGSSGPSGEVPTAKRAADKADNVLCERGYTLVGDPLRDPEER